MKRKRIEWPIMFRSDMTMAILEGRKTETRRMSDKWGKLRKGDLLWVKKGMYGWKKDAKIWLEVQSKPRRVSIVHLTDDDARAEGVASAYDFLKLWDEIHPEDNILRFEKPRPCPYVIKFRRVKHGYN